MFVPSLLEDRDDLVDVWRALNAEMFAKITSNKQMSN